MLVSNNEAGPAGFLVVISSHRADRDAEKPALVGIQGSRSQSSRLGRCRCGSSCTAQ
jgi:hypothetical protein